MARYLSESVQNSFKIRSESVGDHYDATGKKHERDKAEDAERREIHNEPVPAVKVMARTGSAADIFKSHSRNFSAEWRLSHQTHDPVANTKDALESFRRRARLTYLRNRVREAAGRLQRIQKSPVTQARRKADSRHQGNEATDDGTENSPLALLVTQIISKPDSGANPDTEDCQCPDP